MLLTVYCAPFCAGSSQQSSEGMCCCWVQTSYSCSLLQGHRSSANSSQSSLPTPLHTLFMHISVILRSVVYFTVLKCDYVAVIKMYEWLISDRHNLVWRNLFWRIFNIFSETALSLGLVRDSKLREILLKTHFRCDGQHVVKLYRI